MRIIRDPQINEDCKLDDRYQQYGNRYRTEHQDDDQSHQNNGNRVDHLKVMVRYIDQVFRTGCFTDKHSRFIIFIQYTVDRITLPVNLIRRHLIFR